MRSQRARMADLGSSIVIGARRACGRAGIWSDEALVGFHDIADRDHRGFRRQVRSLADSRRSRAAVASCCSTSPIETLYPSTCFEMLNQPRRRMRSRRARPRDRVVVARLGHS